MIARIALVTSHEELHGLNCFNWSNSRQCGSCNVVLYIIYVQLCMCMYDEQIVECTVVNVHFCMSMYGVRIVECVYCT